MFFIRHIRSLIIVASLSMGAVLLADADEQQTQTITIGSQVYPKGDVVKLQEVDKSTSVTYPAGRVTNLLVRKVEGMRCFVSVKLGDPTVKGWLTVEGWVFLSELTTQPAVAPAQFVLDGQPIAAKDLNREASDFFQKKVAKRRSSSFGQQVLMEIERLKIQRRAHAIATSGVWLNQSEEILLAEADDLLESTLVFYTWDELTRVERLLVASSELFTPELLARLLNEIPLDLPPGSRFRQQND